MKKQKVGVGVSEKFPVHPHRIICGLVDEIKFDGKKTVRSASDVTEREFSALKTHFQSSAVL